MVFRPQVDSNLLFVIMPFGAPFDGYYEQIIKPVANDLGRRAVRSDELYGTRAIVEDIWLLIWRASVVIADVTDKNPQRELRARPVSRTGCTDCPSDQAHRRCALRLPPPTMHCLRH